MAIGNTNPQLLSFSFIQKNCNSHSLSLLIISWLSFRAKRLSDSLPDSSSFLYVISLSNLDECMDDRKFKKSKLHYIISMKYNILFVKIMHVCHFKLFLAIFKPDLGQNMLKLSYIKQFVWIMTMTICYCQCFTIPKAAIASTKLKNMD